MAYLDHAATTPMHPSAVAVLADEASRLGNASSLHAAGRRARRVVEESRERVADLLGRDPNDVIFTSGGTESLNLALSGIHHAARQRGRARILTTAVEHHAVLDTVENLAAEGGQIEVVPVDTSGRVAAEDIQSRLSDDVALVAVMWANNELGTVQPIADIGEVCARSGVPLVSDAVQAAAWLDVDVTAASVSALAVSAHKVGGPTGVGALLLGPDVDCDPVSFGGGQERGLRSGTLNVAGIAAFAEALRVTVAERRTVTERVTRLRLRLEAGIRAQLPDAIINGPVADLRLPGILHVSFPACAGDALLMLLDAQGIECSTGSACTAGIAEPSHVLLAIGADPVLARSSLRFSLGHTSTDEDVDAVLRVLTGVVERARRATKVSA